MKKLAILLLLIATTAAWGSNYRTVVEAGDTLVAAIEDTTNRIKLYNGEITNARPVRPTLYIDFDEIGTNSTHYWTLIDVDIAESAQAKDGEWYPLTTIEWNDWLGYGVTGAGGTQNNKGFALPFLDAFAGQYVRFRLIMPVGIAADSTEYAITYEADSDDQMYAMPATNREIVTHKEIWGQTGSALLVGGTTRTTNNFNLTVENSPGVFQMADNVVLNVYGSVADNLCEDDSILIAFKGVNYNTVSNTHIDTLTMAIGAATSNYGIPTFSLRGGGTSYLEAALMQMWLEDGDLEDSCYLYFEISLETNP